MKRSEKQKCKNPVNSMSGDRPIRGNDCGLVCEYAHANGRRSMGSLQAEERENRGLVLYHYPHISTSIYRSVYRLKNYWHTFARRRIGNSSHKSVGCMRVMAITLWLLILLSLRFEGKRLHDLFFGRCGIWHGRFAG